MISQPSSYLKAIFSTLVAVVGQLALVLTEDTTPADLTWGQWMVVAGTALAAFGGTYGITNRQVAMADPPARISGGTTGDL